MPLILQYALESATCMVVLLLPYLVLFRKMTFYQRNRIYLLGAILFALAAPLINLQIETDSNPEIAKLSGNFQFFEKPPIDQAFIEAENIHSKTEAVTSYKQPIEEALVAESKIDLVNKINWWLVTYFTGFSVFTVLFLNRLTRLSRLMKTGKRVKSEGFITIHIVGKQVFSFFHYVFFDHDRYSEKEKITLLTHEKVHIQQWHSVDILVLEILQIVFWFNPLYTFYKKLLQQEHEYFVDAVISNNLGKSKYAQILLTLATTKPPPMGQAFAYIPIKHRIFKLLQKPSTTMEKSKFLIVLPLISVLFFVFSCSVEELEEIDSDTLFTNRSVKSIQAYFVNEYSPLKQEVDVGSMQLNEDGTIADLQMQGHPVFGNSFPNNFVKGYLWKDNAVFFEEIVKTPDLPKDFYSKRIQWLLAGDTFIDLYDLGYIFYYENGQIWLSIEKKILEETMGRYDLTEKYENTSNLYIFNSEREKYGRYTWIKREIKLDISRKITSISQYEKTVNRVDRKYNTGNTLMDSILNAQKQKILASTNIEKTEMKYSDKGLLQSLNSSFSVQSKMSNGQETGSLKSFPKDALHFFYDEKSHLRELHLMNEKNTLLRKYRFYYNEAGYCTKKECINRENKVEFSVWFKYEFFES